MAYDYKPIPFYRTPFGVGLCALAIVIIGLFAWAEWGASHNAGIPTPTSSNPATPIPANQSGGTQP